MQPVLQACFVTKLAIFPICSPVSGVCSVIQLPIFFYAAPLCGPALSLSWLFCPMQPASRAWSVSKLAIFVLCSHASRASSDNDLAIFVLCNSALHHWGWGVVMVYFYATTSPSVVRGGHGWSFSCHLKKKTIFVVCKSRTVVYRKNEQISRILHATVMLVKDNLEKVLYYTNCILSVTPKWRKNWNFKRKCNYKRWKFKQVGGVVDIPETDLLFWLKKASKMGKIKKLDFRVKSTTSVAVVSSSWAEVVYRKKNNT